MRTTSKLILGLLLSLCVASSAFAFQATVVSVHDGDTCTLDTGQRVRLWGVDAPEERSNRWAQQPGADQARDYLAGLVLWQVVEVEQRGRSYGRIVGDITLPDGRHVSGELVAAGWAWVDLRYCRVKSVCGPWSDAQARAQAQGIGLWGLGEVVPPWEWRKKRE